MPTGWVETGGSPVTAAGQTSDEVHIVGLGAQTVLGRTAPSSATAARAGIGRRGPHPFATDRGGEPVIVSMIGNLHERLPLIDRMRALAYFGIEEALRPLGRLTEAPPPIPLVLGLPDPAEELGNPPEDEVAAQLRGLFAESSKIGRIETVPAGHAAGSMALDRATRLVRDGVSPMCLAGGVDTFMDPPVLRALEEQGRLRTGRSPRGFIPGEGAGFCLLASGRAMSGLSSLGRVVATAAAQEEIVVKTDSVCPAIALKKIWAEVLKPLPAGEDITQLTSDMNGEPFRENEFQAAFPSSQGYFEGSFSFFAPSAHWGDVGAASGPLFVIMAAVAGALRPTAGGERALIWTSSDRGERSAVVIALEGVDGDG